MGYRPIELLQDKNPLEIQMFKKPTEFGSGKGKPLNKAARLALKISAV